ncbi:YVTN family beta-propeller protein [Paraburkholderia sp. Clong3]|uniref:YncE family protein n=1 Tax=Paraburkholderia sp. Clong3 TaxID=2991061 RepID=UPI003D238703
MADALAFIPANYESPHPETCAVYVFDAVNESPVPVQTVNIPVQTANSNISALAVAPGGTPVYVLVWPDGATCFLYAINMAEAPPSALVLATPALFASGASPGGTVFSGSMAVSPDGSQVYVADNTDKVFVITTAANNMANVVQVSVGNRPQGIAESPDGTRVYVANSRDGTVSVIDTTTNPPSAVPPSLQVGHEPQGIAVSPDGTRVYVANSGDSTVSMIDTTTNPPSVLPAPVTVGQNPLGIAIAPDGAVVYVAHGDPTDDLYVIDPTNPNTGQIKIPLNALLQNQAFTGAGAVAVTPDGEYVLVLGAPLAPTLPSLLVQIATTGPQKYTVTKTINLSSLADSLLVPQFFGAFVTPPTPVVSQVVSLTFDSNTLALGHSIKGTVRLNEAVVSPGWVTLTWEPLGFATASPAPIPVDPSDGTSLGFTVTAPPTLGPFGDTVGTLYASFGGATVSATLTLEPGADTGVLQAVTVKSPVMVGPNGATTTGTVYLVEPVSGPTNVTVVAVAIHTPKPIKPGTGGPALPVALVGNPVVVPVGQTSETFDILIEPLGATTVYEMTILASAFVTKSTILTLER